MSITSVPLTRADLAEALSCFWNAALGARQNGSDPVGCMAEGIQAIALRLQELDAPVMSLTSPDVARSFLAGMRSDQASTEETSVLVEAGQVWRHNRTNMDFRVTAAEVDEPWCTIEGPTGSAVNMHCDALRQEFNLQPPATPRAVVRSEDCSLSFEREG